MNAIGLGAMERVFLYLTERVSLNQNTKTKEEKKWPI